MKRFQLAVSLAIAVLIVLLGAESTVTGHAHGVTAKSPCAATLGDCPNQGCGTAFDPNLNERKNITSLEGAATAESITWMQKLDDPDNFSQGDDRTELTNLGEGTKIVVVAYLLVAKKEGGESCNCGLTSPADTDNHLVLVKKSTVDQMPLAGTTSADLAAAMKQREPESTTAEFTPRVRLDHPNFTRDTMQPLIAATPQRALWVRVTGQLLFDSEHFLRRHLVRVNNWEIHPILKMEYCTTGSNCTISSDSGWKSIEDL